MDSVEMGKVLKAERRGLSQKAAGIILNCSGVTIGYAERAIEGSRSEAGLAYLQKNLLSRLKKLSDDKIVFLLTNRRPQGYVTNNARDAKIQKLADSGWTYARIAEQFDVTRQRVGQLVKSFVPIEKACGNCGKMFMPKTRASTYCSDSCGQGAVPLHLREQVWREKRLVEITSKIAPPDKNGCWLWQGYINRVTGYGKVGWKGKLDTTHRWMWKQVIGRIPDGVCVLHRCDVPRCVNPKHLFLGSLTDNVKDRDAKGRHNKPHRFALNEIATIRAFYQDTKDCSWLAESYGVHPTTIYSIAKGRSYAT